MLHSVSMVHPSQMRFDVKVRWRAALMTQSQWSSPFLTPEFAAHVGDVRKDARIIIARDHQGMLGILGIHKRPGGFARALGAPVSDHQAFITEAGFDANINDVLKAAGIGAFSFASMNDPYGHFGGAIKREAVSHIADMSDGPEPYFAMQQHTHGRHFKKMRQRTRGAIRDHGTMDLVLDSRDEDDFSLLMQWKRDQYRRTRKCDVLAARWINALLRDLWEQKGRVRTVLNVLYLGGQPAAAEIGLQCNGIYHSWIAAYDPALSRCSPGLLLLEGIMQNARASGITRLDLGAGHDHYKKYYANDAVMLGQGKALGEGFVARQHRMMDDYGSKRFLGAPAKVVNALDFIATCHPSWQGKVRGIAGRLAQIVP